MKITLYKYYGERNRIDKESMLTQVLTTSGKFKADVSMLNPVLLLSLPIEGTQYVTDENNNVIDDVVVNVEDGSVIDFNYLYIAEFRRFYYVTSIVVGSGTLLTLGCEVDPLMSFKDQILENEALVARNEFEYSDILEDALLPLELEKDVTETTPTSGGLVNTTLQAKFYADVNARNIIINTITDVSLGWGDIVPPSGSGLPTYSPQNFSTLGSSTSYAITPWKLRNIGYALLGEDKSARAAYVKSIIAFPFEIENSEVIASNQYIHVGRLSDVDSALYDVANNPIRGDVVNFGSPYRIIANFALPYADTFLDLEPYAHYELYIPFYGWTTINLNADNQGDMLIVYYAINYEDGSATAYVRDMTANKLIAAFPCQIGTRLAVTQSNAQEIDARREAQNTNLAIGAISSILGIAAGAATGNVAMAAGGAIGLVSSVTSYANANALLFERASASFSGSNASFYNSLDVRLRITKPTIRSGLDLAKFAHQYGRPLNQIRTLSSLSGFTQVASIHLEGCTATDAEKRMIVSSLLQGVHL